LHFLFVSYVRFYPSGGLDLLTANINQSYASLRTVNNLST